MLAAISVAARTESNPDFNPRLKTAVETARANQVPNENIERAIKKSSTEKALEEIVIEAYGPEKAALMIEAITDNRNRTLAEVRHLLSEHGAKAADPGSVRWLFDKGDNGWKPKFIQPLSPEGGEKFAILLRALEEHPDVQNVITNT